MTRSKTSTPKKPTPKESAPKGKSKLSRVKSASTELESPSSPSSSSGGGDSSAYEEDSTADTDLPSEEEEEVESEKELDSDNLDEDSDEDPTPKRKRQAKAGFTQPSGSKKKPRTDDPHGKNLREVEVAEKVPAPEEDPETSLILPTTMSFLAQLMMPGHNDRDWFGAHDALYRHALKNYNTFVQAMVPIVSRVDWQVPELPVKDLTHRIYRDVRFSKSKVPYKTNLGATFSRTGRKTDWGMYYMHIRPMGGSVLCAGIWQPEADTTKKIRAAILRNPKKFRQVITNPDFEAVFGKAKAQKGRPSNVFGHEGELKNCPKMLDRDGNPVTKDHPDIDLLKLRSVAVESRFEDDEVLSSEFMSLMEKRIKIAMPFVQMINDMIDPPEEEEEEGEEEEEEEGDAEESD